MALLSQAKGSSSSRNKSTGFVIVYFRFWIDNLCRPCPCRFVFIPRQNTEAKGFGSAACSRRSLHRIGATQPVIVMSRAVVQSVWVLPQIRSRDYFSKIFFHIGIKLRWGKCLVLPHVSNGPDATAKQTVNKKKRKKLLFLSLDYWKTSLVKTSETQTFLFLRETLMSPK